MATGENIQVIRVEIVDGSSMNGTSDSKNPSSTSPGTLLAVGDAKSGGLLGRDNQYYNQQDSMLYSGKRGISQELRKIGRAEALERIKFGINNNKNVIPMLQVKRPIGDKLSTISSGTGMLLRNTEWKTVGRYSTGAASTALAAYSMYSQSQSTGLNLSGASHAAARQQRTTTGATFATGVGISLATGQYWATALMLAGRAWQLGQTNRQEIYKIKSSQIISSVMQERLVKNTIERRF